MPRITPRPLASLGGALAAAALLAACAGGNASPTETVAAHSSAVVADAAPAAPPAEPTVTPSTEAPATTVPTTKKPPATTAPRAAVTTAPPTSAAPATTTPTAAAPAPPKPAPGQRIAFTPTAVQAAAAALHQRIPLFAPTDAQLRTFADAACTSLDQGLSQAQVQSAVSQAVTYVQGASLSPSEAEFMVRTVVALRCPGYLS